MVSTINEALDYYYLIAFLCGFGVLRYPSGYPRVRLSIFYILCVWSIYAYGLYYTLTILLKALTYGKKNVLLKYFVFCFYMTINLLVSTITIVIIIREHKNFSLLINKLNQVDDTLEKLGKPKEYRKMRNLIICIIIIWFIIICITLTTNIVCYGEWINHKQVLFFPIVLNYSYLINILMDLMVMFIIRYIGTRYDKINDYIIQLSETEEYGLRCTWKKSSLIGHYVHRKINQKRILWITMHLHSQLSRVALNINNLFKMQMTLQTMSYFVTMTTMFYFQYPIMLYILMNGDMQNWRYLFCNNLSGAFDLIRVILLNNMCENVSGKAQKTRDIIHKLTNIICFAKAREEIFHFVLQITLRPLKFSGMGLFYFGHKFLWKFLMWMISIMILIIQIQQIDLNRENVTCSAC